MPWLARLCGWQYREAYQAPIDLDIQGVLAAPPPPRLAAPPVHESHYDFYAQPQQLAATSYYTCEAELRPLPPPTYMSQPALVQHQQLLQQQQHYMSGPSCSCSAQHYCGALLAELEQRRAFLARSSKPEDLQYLSTLNAMSDRLGALMSSTATVQCPILYEPAQLQRLGWDELERHCASVAR